jgi:hypothetical protein
MDLETRIREADLLVIAQDENGTFLSPVRFAVLSMADVRHYELLKHAVQTVIPEGER